MKFEFQSAFITSRRPGAIWRSKHPILSLVWEPFSWIFATMAILGTLVAPTFVAGVGFQILRAMGVHPPSIGYWVLASLLLLFVLAIVCLTGRHLALLLRERTLHLESISYFLGFLLALVFTIWTIPTGWT